MRLGRFDTFIQIVRDGEAGRDAFNAPIIDETVFADCMAERVQASGREFLAGDAVEASVRVVFRTHWVSGISRKDRVRCGDQTYNIREVRPLGRNRHMELHTEGVAP